MRLYRIESAPSLALNPAIKLTFQQVTWRTMRAFKHLHSSTGYLHHSVLNHMTRAPNSTGPPRDATLRNAPGEILMQTDHKVSSMPYEDVLVLGIYWLSTFNLTNSAQKLRVHYCLRVGIVSFHNCHFHAARLEYLRLCQTGNSRQILHS